MTVFAKIKLNSIFMRLLLAFWLLCAGILLLGGLYINRAVESEFASLVTDTRQQKLEEITTSVTEILQSGESDRSVEVSIRHLAHTHNERLIVTDTDGEIIIDSGEGNMMGPGMMGERGRDSNMGMHNHMPGRGEETSSEEFLEDFEDEQIAQNTYSLDEMGLSGVEVTILPTDREQGLYNPRELDFTTQVTRSIFIGGLIALIISGIVSFFITFSISKPIDNLKNTVNILRQGDLSPRAEVQGPDELQELADNFNSMAESLERADFLKKKLTQDLSHELNNPVASLKGYLEAFQDGVLEINEENLQSTVQEIIRLEDLSKDLHQLTKVDFRGPRVNLQQLDLIEFGEEVWKSAWSQGFLHDIEVDFSSFEEELTIEVDEELLYAAVNNLIRNAIKHTPKGGNIEIQVYNENRQGVIAVSDTGTGIHDEELENIFERFYRIDDNSRSKPNNLECQEDDHSQGCGIGLSLVKEWTEAMGGEVLVDSTPGVGSTFKLIFPLFFT